MDSQGAEFEIIPSTSYQALARIDCIAIGVHPSIWGLEGRPGSIPASNSKMKRLYRHLIVTHVPPHGRPYRGGVEVWLNRSGVSNRAGERFSGNAASRTSIAPSPIRCFGYPVLRSMKRSAERMRGRVGGSKKAKAS